MPDKFILHSEFQPTGDQPQAIDKLVRGIEDGDRAQTLLGVTGSGKTFTMANVIARLNRPTLCLLYTSAPIFQHVSPSIAVFAKSRYVFRHNDKNR